MKISIQVSEVDEVLMLYADRYLKLEKGSSLSLLLDKLVQMLRKGLIQFSDQHVSVPALADVNVVSTSPRMITLLLETRMQQFAEKYLDKCPFIKYRNVTKDKQTDGGLIGWIQQKLQTMQYAVIVELDSIPGAKEQMDKFGFVLKDFRISSEEVTVVASVGKES